MRSSRTATRLLPCHTYATHQAAVQVLLWSNNGRSLFSGSSDKTIKQWNVVSSSVDNVAPLLKEVREFRGHTGSVWALALSTDQEALFSASADYTIKQWDLTTGQCLLTLMLHQPSTFHGVTFHGVTALAVCGDNLWSTSIDTYITQWDLQHLGEYTNRTIAPVHTLLLSRDTQYLFCGGRMGFLVQYKICPAEDNGTSLEFSTGYTGHTNNVNTMVLSPDGQTLFSGSEDHTIIEWCSSQPQTLRGTYIRFGTESRDSYTRYPLQTLKGHTAAVKGLVLSPEDHRILFSVSLDQTLRQWDIESGTCLRQLTLHSGGGITALVLSPQGRGFFSASADHTLKQWVVLDLYLLSTLLPRSLPQALYQLLLTFL